MPSRFYYILMGLVIISVYLIYSIGYYTLQQFQTSNFINSIQVATSKTLSRNREKEFLAQYIHTKAYQTQVAKATHNKKLPGEEAINIIHPDDVERNKDQDPKTVIADAREREDDPMKDMSNPEKWWYLLKKGL